MTKPTFETLRKNHHSSDRTQGSRFLDGASVYKEIGHDIDQLVRQNPGYHNTCAIRMSLALMKSGVAITGRLRVRDGQLKGRSVEPGAKLLADQLSNEALLGKPLLLDPKGALKKLEGKKGVIFFWKVAGYGGGHIDLIQVTNSAAVCSSACYLDSKEIWFWPLE